MTLSVIDATILDTQPEIAEASLLVLQICLKKQTATRTIDKLEKKTRGSEN